MGASGKRLPPGRNLLRNGDFLIAQRGDGPFTSATAPTNGDDTYQLDGWVFLADGADICDVSRVATDLPSGARGKLRLDVETANKKFGVVQIVEQADALEIIGGTASLSFKARGVSSGTLSINNLRAAVLSWSSTADSVTSDVVSAWGDAGTNPTWATNWTAENTPANLALSTDWQEYRIAGISIDTASAANVAVVIWVDDTDAAAGDFLEVTDVKLEAGSACTAFDRQPKAVELARCKRYFNRLVSGNNIELPCGGRVGATNSAEVGLPFPEMRTAPSVAVSAASHFQGDDGAAATLSGLSGDLAGLTSLRLVASQGGSTWTVGRGFVIRTISASATLDLAAEL